MLTRQPQDDYRPVQLGANAAALYSEGATFESQPENFPSHHGFRALRRLIQANAGMESLNTTRQLPSLLHSLSLPLSPFHLLCSLSYYSYLTLHTLSY